MVPRIFLEKRSTNYHAPLTNITRVKTVSKRLPALTCSLYRGNTQKSLKYLQAFTVDLISMVFILYPRSNSLENYRGLEDKITKFKVIPRKSRMLQWPLVLTCEHNIALNSS